MWIDRIAVEEIKKLTQTFPVVVLTGSRQVGKTSLLERYFPNYTYISLDSIQLADSALSRPTEFLEKYKPPVIIDEIQYAPSLMRAIKEVVDRNKKKGEYLLTGSQSFPLMQAVSESLAGRAAVINLNGLSAEEWLGNEILNKKYSIKDFFWRGSYPGLWSDPKLAVDRNRWYQSYITTYLERDVRNLVNVGRLRDFERFLRACATRTAQVLNLSDLARDTGISPTTAKEWLNVLHASCVVFLLEPYYSSLGKRITKSPKLYFNDTALAMFLCGFENLESIWNSTFSGAFWENHVVCQWQRWRDWKNPLASLWFWQDKTKNEVDLIIELNQKMYAIECKRNENPNKSDAKGILKLIDFYGKEKIGHAYVACTTPIKYDIVKGISAVNAWTTWEFEKC